ncbi:MAG TPA: GvpL/GvpF family gas vesicle protein [Trebonia sp.]
MSEDSGVWAYAITEEGHLSGPEGPVDLSWLTGVGEAKVRTVTSGGLAALVSDVSLAEFGEAALRENLENLDWLDEVAREHHYVIDAATRLFPLLPVRLATVYTGDAAVSAALTERGGQLRDALRRVGGRVEWGVKAYAAQHEPEGPNEAEGPDEAKSADADGEPAGGSAQPRTEGGVGLAYLRRRRAQLTAARETKTAAVTGAQEVHAELTAKAADARLHPPQSPQLSGVRQPMLLNAAYLLDAAGSVAFTAAVGGQATAHPELRVELTGPWPPYSFVGGDDDGR